MERQNGIPQKKKSSNPPNQTLYVSNLPDKLQKSDLRRSLYMLFSSYGPVLDIVALKTMKMRGQAHVVYRDIQTSSQALRALQGFEFFGRTLRVSYAKGKSDIISKLDGSAKIQEHKEPQVVSTDLQRSIFNHGGAAPPHSLKAPAEEKLLEGSKSPQGTKRRRIDMESDDEEEAKPNGTTKPPRHDQEEEESEDDDDEGEAMEESDED